MELDGKQFKYRAISDTEEKLCLCEMLSYIDDPHTVDVITEGGKLNFQRVFSAEDVNLGAIYKASKMYFINVVYYGSQDFYNFPDSHKRAIQVVQKFGEKAIKRLSGAILEKSGYGREVQTAISKFRDGKSRKMAPPNRPTVSDSTSDQSEKPHKGTTRLSAAPNI